MTPAAAQVKQPKHHHQSTTQAAVNDAAVKYANELDLVELAFVTPFTSQALTQQQCETVFEGAATSANFWLADVVGS